MSRPNAPDQSESIGPLDFDYIRALVRKKSSIVLDGTKTYLVASRLLPLARARGFDTIGALISRLQSTQFGELHTLAVESIATTETSFFRDHHPFVALRDDIIPELLRRKQSNHSLSIWSAACASGQEPHSVAMILRDRFADLNGRNLQLMASDFSRGMLDRAREGLYTQLEINRGLPAPYLVRFFSQHEDQWLLAPEVRRMFRFFHQNLTSEWTLPAQVDVVMMRNVLIYFDVETRRELLRRVRRILRPGGYLLLGSAETTLNLDDYFTRVPVGRAIFYQVTKGGER